MPVVVNQLKIKSNVKDSGDKKSSSSAKGSGKEGGKVDKEERDLIIKECVRRVMEELRFKNVR